MAAKTKRRPDLADLDARIAALQGEIADLEAERDAVTGKPRKSAAKPTRWWGTFDGLRPDRPPILDATEADARRSAESQTRYYFAPGRFVVRRVELREV